MSQAIDICFVVPCHNSGIFLQEAVTSILNQPSTLDFEVIVVDDNSDDRETRGAIEQCSATDQVSVVALSRRAGVQAARNAGIRATSATYIMQVDADDRLSTDPRVLTAGPYSDRAVEQLEARPEIAFVHTMSWMFGDFDGYTISSYPCQEPLVVRKHHVPTAVVCRRSDAVHGGFYDEEVTKWGDWSFAINLLAGRFRRGLPNNIGFVAGPHYEYRVHQRPGRVSSITASEAAMTLRVVQKNLDYFRAILESDDDASQIARAVLDRKPTRLDDLLHMAAYDLGQALDVAHSRGFTVTNPPYAREVP